MHEINCAVERLAEIDHVSLNQQTATGQTVTGMLRFHIAVAKILSTGNKQGWPFVTTGEKRNNNGAKKSSKSSAVYKLATPPTDAALAAAAHSVTAKERTKRAAAKRKRKAAIKGVNSVRAHGER